MKIFGWMHRKLHLGSTEYHRVAHRNSPDMLFDDEIGRKGGAVPGARERSEDDTDSLLLPHVLLAIGTFGHSDPLQQQQQISHGEQQHEEEALGHAEEPAPEFTAKITAAAPELNAPGELEMTVIAVKQQEIAEEEMASEEPLLKEDKEKTERRTTLADLFAAEPASAGDRPSPPEAVSAAGKEKAAGPRKKAKKAKDRSPVSTNATERIHQLITKMLKKKVHPDVMRADEERRGKREGAASTSEGNEGGRLPLARG